MIWVNYISGNKYSNFVIRTQEKPEIEIDFSYIPNILRNLLNFLNEYYVVYPDKLPKSELL
jgi:hypothetical protein